MWFFVLVLFDPARSAEPPIKVLFPFVSASSVSSEDFLVAKVLISFTEICFCFFRIFVKLFFKNLFMKKFFFFSSTLFHLFSSNSPFFPIVLHSFKIFLEFQMAYSSNLNFFLTSFISSKPRGLPCDEDFPDLLGEP